MNDFSGWIPMRIYWRNDQAMVDWGHLGLRRFTDPFFVQTITPCVQHPADLLFRPQTPLEQLGQIAPSQLSVRPTGFIFHMSRCGSTLLAQMLAAAPANIVLSEAGPVDDILRAHFRNPTITTEERVQWLQWLVKILGWKRHPEQKHLFIKFDCWHIMLLPLIRRAFPEVPWIFLYRDPIEVLASAQKQLGGQMIPGVLEPDLFGWDAAAVGRMTLMEYAARVLAKLCEAAHAQVQVQPGGQGKLVNYQQLPEAVWPALRDYWQVNFSAAETAQMLGAASQNAKNPVLSFTADSQAKQASASDELRMLASRWMDQSYRNLEAQRLATGFA